MEELARGTLQSLVLLRLGIIEDRLRNKLGALTYVYDALAGRWMPSLRECNSTAAPVQAKKSNRH